MRAKRRSRGRQPRIDAAAKVAMLAAIREGRRLDEVAAAYRVTLQAFYSARRRDPVFAAAWGDAHAASAEAERRLAGEADGDQTRIMPNNRRPLQRRWMRHVRFDERRKGVFLAHFAWNCDLGAAAAAAGVCERTVFNHLRRDPAFAKAFQAALRQGMMRLDAETLRDRLEAQRRLGAAIEAAEDGLPEAEEAAVEFDRAMKLLARWDRKNGPPGPRGLVDRHGKRWDFEESVSLLEKKLRSLAISMGVPPPEGAG